MTIYNIELIAKVVHNVNRAFCITMGDNSQEIWENAPQWQKDSVINAINRIMENDSTPEQVHEMWMEEKLRSGWVYGDVKDVELKTHPCIVPYNELSHDQKVKDHLVKAVIDSFK